MTRELILTEPRDHKKYYFHATSTRKFIVEVVKILVTITIKPTYLGQGNLPKEGAVILVANHLTNFDVFVMQTAMLDRPIFFMAKSELFNPLLDGLLRNLGAFPVIRGERDNWAIRHAEKILETNKFLVCSLKEPVVREKVFNLEKLGPLAWQSM